MSDVEIVFTHEAISGDCEEAEREIKRLRARIAALDDREAVADALIRANGDSIEQLTAALAAQTARAERAEAVLGVYADQGNWVEDGDNGLTYWDNHETDPWHYARAILAGGAADGQDYS